VGHTKERGENSKTATERTQRENHTGEIQIKIPRKETLKTFLLATIFFIHKGKVSHRVLALCSVPPLPGLRRSPEWQRRSTARRKRLRQHRARPGTQSGAPAQPWHSAPQLQQPLQSGVPPSPWDLPARGIPTRAERPTHRCLLGALLPYPTFQGGLGATAATPQHPQLLSFNNTFTENLHVFLPTRTGPGTPRVLQRGAQLASPHASAD